MKLGKVHLGLLIALLVVLLVACGGGESGADERRSDESGVAAAGDPAAGEEQYNVVCTACHGPGGVGIEGLGKDMTTSEFISGQSDQELLAFVKVGRSIGDPLNTTGVDMPAKGGNPALNDDQIIDIIAYMRTLQQ